MRYKSCEFIEQGLFFLYDEVLMCCYSIGTRGESIPLVENFHGEKINWDNLLAYKQQIKEAHKVGDITPQCKDCVQLIEKDWEEKNTINNIIIAHWVKCNCNCTYCQTRNTPEFYNKYKHYKIMPIFEDMLEKNVIEFDGNILFGGGEPTQLKELDEILDFFVSNGTKRININSSAIDYSKAIAKALSKDALSLTVSVDSGSNETYKKIKRTNTYNRVWDNIKKYQTAQGKNKSAVRTKYIIIPGSNDNIDEIEKWLQKNVQANVKNIELDIESIWFSKNKDRIPESIYELVSYVQKRAPELNLTLSYYSVAEQLIYEKQNKANLI